MFTKAFLRDLLERAIRAAAAALLGVFGAGATVANVDWQFIAVTVGTAALVSVSASLLASGRGAGTDGSRTASFLAQ